MEIRYFIDFILNKPEVATLILTVFTSIVTSIYFLVKFIYNYFQRKQEKEKRRNKANDIVILKKIIGLKPLNFFPHGMNQSSAKSLYKELSKRNILFSEEEFRLEYQKLYSDLEYLALHHKNGNPIKVTQLENNQVLHEFLDISDFKNDMLNWIDKFEGFIIKARLYTESHNPYSD